MGSANGQTRRFRATPDEMRAADAWIEEIGRYWGVAERTAFGARICVAEIAANILEHGASTGGPPNFGVTLRRRGTGIEIEITDTGQPFDLTTAAELPLPETIETAPIGGLGLRLVRAYASEIAYRHDGVCNRHTLHLPASVS